MHPRLTELLDYVDAQREQLRAVVESIPSSKHNHVSPAGGWTILGVLEHLAIVESRIASLIRKMTTEARAAGVRAETETSSILPSLDLVRFLDRGRKLDAPKSTQPKAARRAARRSDPRDRRVLHLPRRRRLMLREIERGAQQRDVREALRKIAALAADARIVFLRQQSDVVAERE